MVDVIAIALKDIEGWDNELVELVKEEKINPWDIDIKLLTEKYLERIGRIVSLDFRIPAKALLTAAVLLRLKSEKIFFEEKKKIERLGKEKPLLDVSVVPDLHPVRRVVERKVTVVELAEALRNAFEIEKKKIRRRTLLRQIVRVSSFDMGELIESLTELLNELFKKTDRISVKDLRHREFALLFLAILHLANDGFIELEQEDWNTEIFIIRTPELKVELESKAQ